MSIISFVSFQESISIAFIITLQKFLVTLKPFLARSMYKVCLYMVMITWLLWVIIAAIPFLTMVIGEDQYKMITNNRMCLLFDLSITQKIWKYYFGAILAIFNILFLIANSVFSIGIFCMVKKSSQISQNSRSTKKLKILRSKMLLSVVGSWLCYFPLVCMSLVSLFMDNGKISDKAWTAISFCVLPLPSLTNPIISAWQNFISKNNVRSK